MENSDPQVAGEPAESAAAPGPVQDGPVGLGEHPIMPPVLSAEEQKAREQAQTDLGVAALEKVLACVREANAELDAPGHSGVGGAKSLLGFVAGRLDVGLRDLRHA